MNDETQLKSPSLGDGKICYVEIPAIDVRASADFYSKVFGWKIRQRDDGSIAFDDGVGQVSGTWVVGRPAATEPGLLIYIMVNSVASTIEAIVARGGKIVEQSDADEPHIIASFRDPVGNLLGLYQEVGG